MERFWKHRAGITLIDVALAGVILSVGTLFVGRFLAGTFEQLNPRGAEGGLRRYVMAEEMLKAQAEGLRLLRPIPVGGTECKLITEPAGLGYSLGIVQYPLPSPEASEQMYYYDLSMTHQGQTIGTLSLSTLRLTNGAIDEKIGL